MKIEGKQRLWNEYQKDIPDNNYYYARSCIRQNFFPGSEVTFLRILRDYLHKDVFDDAHQTTCTGIAYHSALVPYETTRAVVARQFSLMNQAKYKNFVPSCVTSFGVYSEVLETWKNFPDTLIQSRQQLKEATGREFLFPDNITHTSDIIYKFRDEIAALSRYSLTNKATGEPLKVVDHIGCHYAKMFPSKGIGGAEYPYVLTGMVESWGGTVVDYPERRHCCGFGFRNYVIKENRGYSLSNSKIKFDSMEPCQPDFIVANCPGCTFFLDRWQYVIAELTGKTYDMDGFGIPVLTYEEMAGLVLGMDPWDLGMQLHQVSVEPLLVKMGIKFDASKKYSGYLETDIGTPDNTITLKTKI